jgi:hypothetical protein
LQLKLNSIAKFLLFYADFELVLVQTYPQQTIAQWFAEFVAEQVIGCPDNFDSPNQIIYEKKLHEIDVKSRL